MDLKVLTQVNNTAFTKVRQALEIVINYMKNGITLQIKDACRNCLTILLQEFELEHLRKFLSKEDSDFLTEIEGKFVAKKYNSRMKEKMGADTPKQKFQGDLEMSSI